MSDNLNFQSNYDVSLFCLIDIQVSSGFFSIKISFRSSVVDSPGHNQNWIILGDPGAASRDDGIFMGESLQQERESPWALTLTERVPEAFEIPPSDWPEKYFSGQSAKRNSRATLMSSYTRLFSSSNAVVAWPVQREHF